MSMELRCPNPTCGHPSTLGNDRLGRVFRCTRCWTRLPAGPRPRVIPTPPAPIDVPSRAARPEAGVPARLGRFQLRATLGAGSFAMTYRAFDPVLQREVALKILRVAAPEGPEGLERLLNEPRAMARLRHPRIVPIYEVGCDGERHYLVMACIEGRSLDRVVEDGPIDVRRGARIVRDLAGALDYAHGRGIVHRDVKPANLMLDHKDRAYLMDFGLARPRGPSREGASDRIDRIQGTPAYLAPELAHGGGVEFAPASDQYSLGVVLYELLCGRTPFQGPPLMMLFHAAYREPPPPRSLAPEVPPQLERICLRAMAKRPEDRFPTCRALADELRRWLRAHPSRPRRPATASSPPLRLANTPSARSS